jgi:hypothetical protein
VATLIINHKKSRLDRSYYIEGELLNRRQVVKDLGVLFDEKLSFRPHYESIANKSHKLLGFIIRSTKDFKQASSTITLFYSLEVFWSTVVRFGHRIIQFI